MYAPWSAPFGRPALIRARALPEPPECAKRVETGGNAFPWLHKRSERQKFELGGLGREKRAHQIWLNSVKLARRRRKAPESPHQDALTQGGARKKAGQHSLPGGSEREDPSGKSERRDLVEWSEECAFQSMNNTFVKCRGRRFSRDLLGLSIPT